MSQFDELLAQLNAEQEEQSTLAKALPAEDGEDDEAIQAASAEGDTDADDENPEDHEEPDGDEGKGKPMAKSMTVDGEEFEVVDADQLIKSLHDLTERVGTNETVLAKALESTLGTIKAQGEMIKSLNARVEKLAGQGRGRKTVLAVHEKPAVDEPLTKSQPQGLTSGELMAKATAAFSAGKLSGLELTTIDVSLRTNQQIDQGLLAKALS